jgi:hypothetical protein
MVRVAQVQSPPNFLFAAVVGYVACFPAAETELRLCSTVSWPVGHVSNMAQIPSAFYHFHVSWFFLVMYFRSLIFNTGLEARRSLLQVWLAFPYWPAAAALQFDTCHSTQICWCHMAWTSVFPAAPSYSFLHIYMKLFIHISNVSLCTLYFQLNLVG